LKNPILHDFGTWGEWDECPSGTFATGFKLKLDWYRGEKLSDECVLGAGKN